MTEESQREKLKQHFARRVSVQARVTVETWQRARLDDAFTQALQREMAQATKKLVKYARRFEMEYYAVAADNLLEALASWGGDSLENTPRKAIETAIDALSRHILEHIDQEQEEPAHSFLGAPVYLALNNRERMHHIIKQMEFFNFRAQAFTSPEALLERCQDQKPEIIVIDVSFGGSPLAGIEAVKTLQARYQTPIPTLYLSEEDGSIETRLKASRSGGEAFFFPDIDPGQLIEKIETYSRAKPVAPYRVLVVDDSRAQAKFVEVALRKAGMESCIITDPMQVVRALDEFSPEIIVLDMYMPGCTGMEIARVIRQQERLDKVPIIYLSAEEDVSKQLHAMSLGGDDFLTKPIDPDHLIATLHNRGRRARSLQAPTIRDSLSGLYNHNHTLYLLDSEISRARQQHTRLTYGVIDIDLFHRVNHVYGHPMGDRVLRSLSLCLKQSLGKIGHIGRYGGEEFAIILPDTGASHAHDLLNEARGRFSEIIHSAGDSDFRVSFSAGIAAWNGESSRQLCKLAEEALDAAKKAGRNRVMPTRPEDL